MRAAARCQVRDAKTGGPLSPQFLEALGASLWQVAIGAAHPKRLSGIASAGAAQPLPVAAGATPRRGSGGGSISGQLGSRLSLTTVAEARSRRASHAPSRRPARLQIGLPACAG